MAGDRVAVVQSARITPYELAIKGFRKACPADVDRFVLAEQPFSDIATSIKNNRPDLILAVGRDALEQIKHHEDIPIIYLLVPNPDPHLTAQPNITGLAMQVPPARQLKIFRDILPRITSIGLLYDPGYNARLVTDIQDAAAGSGIELIVQTVQSPRDVPAAIAGLENRIDAFWMLPDRTVITPITLEYLLLFSMKHKIPVLSFSKKYTQLGALLAVSIDLRDLGRQAGELATNIMHNKSITKAHPPDIRSAVTTVNRQVARKLGLNLKKKTMPPKQRINQAKDKYAE
ncbi:MAG: ABC transporter substrate-binding protein [Deltaproteobacteria bacterium]|nr:ABC transporter substrate-binding protein [Deltaproteobacteria bacterium]